MNVDLIKHKYYLCIKEMTLMQINKNALDRVFSNDSEYFNFLKKAN